MATENCADVRTPAQPPRTHFRIRTGLKQRADIMRSHNLIGTCRGEKAAARTLNSGSCRFSNGA